MLNWLRKCSIIAVFLISLVLLDTGLTVNAAPPDTGSFKIKLKEQEHDIKIAVYKVADYKNGNYELLPEFSEGNINLNNIENASESEQCAREILNIVNKKKTESFAECVIKGEKDFGKMPLGMYLVSQIEREEEKLYITPFLVGIPYWEVEIGSDGIENKTLIYNVISYPKEDSSIPDSESTDMPSDKTPSDNNSSDNTSVKTGDENFEKIIFHMLLLIAASGVIIRARRKAA